MHEALDYVQRSRRELLDVDCRQVFDNLQLQQYCSVFWTSLGPSHAKSYSLIYLFAKRALIDLTKWRDYVYRQSTESFPSWYRRSIKGFLLRHLH